MLHNHDAFDADLTLERGRIILTSTKPDKPAIVRVRFENPTQPAMPEFIPGSPPDLHEPPAGCRFAPRCPLVEPRCTAAEIPLYSVDGSLVRCVLHEGSQ